MKALAENIQRLRKAAGLTQDELGRKVGVSMQAVSRWENGGLPDAELLPDIASALNTSIDALFGRDVADTADTLKMVAADVARTLPDERFNRAWRIAAEAVAELCVNQSEYADEAESMRDMIQHILFAKKSDSEGGGMPYHARISTAAGLSTMCAQPGNYAINIIPRPKDGYEAMLSRVEDYKRLFDLLSRDHRLDMMIYLCSRPDTAFTAEVASKALGIGVEETKTVIRDLRDHNFLHKQAVETADGVVNAYQTNHNMELVPFLYAARELMYNDTNGFVNITHDTKLLNNKPGTGARDPVWKTTPKPRDEEETVSEQPTEPTPLS